MHILAELVKDRLGVISFYIEGLHFNLAVKLLNDRFGVQVRGGCSCAGTYGHYLLEVSYEKSKMLTDEISLGILANKPGWVRMSIHPTMTNREIEYILDAIDAVARNHQLWSNDYKYDSCTNEWTHKTNNKTEHQLVQQWYNINFSGEEN